LLYIHLDGFVLQTQSIESIYGFFGIFSSVVIDESVTQTLPCFQIESANGNRKKERNRVDFLLNSDNIGVKIKFQTVDKLSTIIDLKIKTCDFVADEFATLDFANGGEQGANLFLGHRLWQVINNQVSLALVIFGYNVLRSLYEKKRNKTPTSMSNTTSPGNGFKKVE
jgi:hypothetical protein